MKSIFIIIFFALFAHVWSILHNYLKLYHHTESLKRVFVVLFNFCPGDRGERGYKGEKGDRGDGGERTGKNSADAFRDKAPRWLVYFPCRLRSREMSHAFILFQHIFLVCMLLFFLTKFTGYSCRWQDLFKADDNYPLKSKCFCTI